MSARDGSLLLHCLGIRANGQANSRPPMPTMWEWAEVFRQAAENNITSLLYHRLKTVLPAPEVPPGALDGLRDIAVRSAAHSLQVGRELGHVLEAFRRHDIPVIVLKGGHLGQVVYESFALRTMCDLDVMVRRDGLTKAAGVLGDLGYAPQYYGVEEVDYEQHHHIRPMARAEGVRVELHWSIAPPDPTLAVDLEGMWERARRIDLSGVESRVLSPEDLILHLCLHASYSHKFRAGLRACWDILELVRHYGPELDWDEVVRRAHEWRIGKYVYLTLRLVRELLEVDIPVTAIAALEPPGCPPEVVAWARRRIFTPENHASVSPSMAQLWTSRRFKAKVGVMLHTMYLPRAAMARIYGTRADSSRVYLYYLVRWADLLLRYGRHAWGLWRGDHHVHDDLRAVSERTALNDWLGDSVSGRSVSEPR
jgi:putative nucleotidyltransferase-like protein